MSKGAISDKAVTDDAKMAPTDQQQSGRHGKNAEIRARQRAIGRELRRMYDEIAREPIPEDFIELLRQLDAQDGKMGAGKTEDGNSGGGDA